MYKSKRAKATDITKAVKDAVWERDKHRCTYCGSRCAMPNAHVVSRSKGGLGIEKNIVTLCIWCHQVYDQGSIKQKQEYAKKYGMPVIDDFINRYMKRIYGDIDKSKVTYRRRNAD